MPSNAIFISYRRSVSWSIAQLIHNNMVANGIDAFLDIENLAGGKFLKEIFEEIAARPYFVLVLTPGTLDRCIEDGDVLRKEIDEAIRLSRIIIPLFTSDFEFADLKRYTPNIVDEIKGSNGRMLSAQQPLKYLMLEIRERFLLLTEIVLPSASSLDNTKVIETQAESETVSSTIIETQLTIDEYYERAFSKSDEGDYVGTIADFTKVLSIKPDDIFAYYNRGNALKAKGDFNAAIIDFNECVRLNPIFAFAYTSRGLSYYEKGDYNTAENDFSESLRMDPLYSASYLGRGKTRHAKGDYTGAIADFTIASRIDPEYPYIYVLRAATYLSVGMNELALQDFRLFLQLAPDSAEAQDARKVVNTLENQSS